VSDLLDDLRLLIKPGDVVTVRTPNTTGSITFSGDRVARDIDALKAEVTRLSDLGNWTLADLSRCGWMVNLVPGDSDEG
jgi:hypothetical protein